MKGNKLSKQEPLNKGTDVPFRKFKRERQTLNRNNFHFKGTSTWEQTFHTLVKMNNYCKKEPINRNNCSLGTAAKRNTKTSIGTIGSQ